MRQPLLDFHSHILPGIDDGSKNLEMSMEMIRQSVSQGITGIVLTPHFYADSDEPEAFLERRQGAADQLLPAARAEFPDMPFLLGAEVHYYRGMGQSALLERFCIGNSNMVLVEMPFRSWSEKVLRDIEDIGSHLGLQVLIAHIDRYLSMEKPAYIEALRYDAKAVIQANADFFLQFRTRRKAIRMLRRGEIHLLGSDCHNMGVRAPNLGPAVSYIEAKLGPDALAAVNAQGERVFRQAAKTPGGV